MTTLLQDVRYGLRTLLKMPGVTATAVLSLALGIGANAAIFSLLDAFGLRPLPVADEARLVRVFSARGAAREQGLSYPDYLDLRDTNHVFSGLAAYSNRGVAISSGSGPPEVLPLGVISGNFLPTLGVRPSIGRQFLPEEDRTPRAARVAIISHRLWQRRFGGDPGIAGASVILNSEPWTVVGVLPAEFTGLEPQMAPDVWIPIASFGRADQDRRDRSLKVVGRLKDGVTVEQAQAEVTTLMAGLALAYPASNTDWSGKVSSLRDVRRRTVSTLGPFLLLIVGFVLLIACANVAGLLLGRADARRREIAVRVALGAGRGRLLRQLLTESVLLSAGACTLGLLLALWLIRLLPTLLPPAPIPLGYVFRLDARVLMVTLLAGIAVAPTFGLAPALMASRPDVLPLLRGQTTGGGRLARRVSARNVLVVGQIAVSMVLLVGSGLLVRSLLASRRIEPGFGQDPALLVGLAPGVAGMDDVRSRAFLDQLVQRVSALPGVRGTALARRIPLSPIGGGATLPVVIPGRPLEAGREPDQLRYNIVSRGYFDVMNVRLLRGRDFEAGDGPDSTRVVIINDAMARRYFPNDDPIGRAIRVGSPAATDWQIIGIVQDGRYVELTEAPEPHLFFPFSQRSSGEMTLIARISGDGRQEAEAVRREIDVLSPGMPTLQILTLKEHLKFALYGPELIATLVSTIGIAGLLLATVGLYGVISFLVGRRTRDIGIRMALGASRGDVTARVVAAGVGLAAVGVAVGLAGAFWASRFLQGNLYGVSARDPLTFAATALLVIAVAAVASYLPARRAARVDPLVALRCE